MIRVMYLLSIDDRRYRSSLVACTLSGQKWHERESRSKLTDRQMVDLAGRLHGWAQYVYAFGCAFIHLTNASSLKPDDRLSSLPSLTEADRLAIVTYLRHYHGGPAADDPSMREIGCLLVGVFDKIAGNLGRYLQLLENDEMLER